MDDEANAALAASSGAIPATYQEFLTRLAQASGIETPTRADLARLDRKRPKKGRNTDAASARPRRAHHENEGSHLAHKAEHAVDLETGAMTVADQGDTTTIAETVITDGHTAILDEVVALVDLATLDLRTYIAEPDSRARRSARRR